MDEFSWGKVTATLVGTFTGAILAFGSALVLGRWKDDAAHLAAGNLALFQLGRISTGVLHLRALYWWSIDEQRRRLAAAGRSAPPAWMLPVTPVHKISTEVELDIPSLSFLSRDEPGRSSLIACHTAFRAFEVLRMQLDRLQTLESAQAEKFAEMATRLADQRMEKLKGIPVTNLPEYAQFAQIARAAELSEPSEAEMEAAIDLVTRDRSEHALLDVLLGIGLALHIANTASRHLRAALVIRFPRGGVWADEIEPVDSLAVKNLPPLPAVLDNQVKPALARALEEHGSADAEWISNPPPVPWLTSIWRNWLSPR